MILTKTLTFECQDFLHMNYHTPVECQSQAGKSFIIEKIQIIIHFYYNLQNHV